MKTTHSLKTKLGIEGKKKYLLEQELAETELKLKEAVKPSVKSAPIESTKDLYRLLISMVIGMAVSYVYSRFPILGELQPDQSLLVTVLVGLAVKYLDTYLHTLQRNKGKAKPGQGLELPLMVFGKLMESKKGLIHK